MLSASSDVSRIVVLVSKCDSETQGYSIPHPPFLDFRAFGNRVDLARPPRKHFLADDDSGQTQWQIYLFDRGISPNGVVVSLAHFRHTTYALVIFVNDCV